MPVTAWRCGLISISACLHRSISAGFFEFPERPRYLSALPMQSRSRFRKMIWPLYFGARFHTSAQLVMPSGTRSERKPMPTFP